MSRRMACSLTIDAVNDRTKTVTRRRADSWVTLKVGDRLTLVEKAMGLAKGEKQVVLANVEIVAVHIEPIERIISEPDGTANEGLGHMTSMEFIMFWLDSHGKKPKETYKLNTPCRRIEWRYLDV